METVMLVSLIYAGVFMIACIGMSLILAYVVYMLKTTRATTY